MLIDEISPIILSSGKNNDSNIDIDDDNNNIGVEVTTEAISIL